MKKEHKKYSNNCEISFAIQHTVVCIARQDDHYID